MRPVSRRALLGAGTALAGLGVAGALALPRTDPYRRGPRLPAGRLTIPDDLRGTHPVGRHTLVLGPGFALHDDAGRPLWWADEAMLAAGSQQVRWTDVIGHQTYRANTRVETHVHVDGLRTTAAGATLRGHVGQWQWHLELTSGGPADGLHLRLAVPGADTVTLRGRLAPGEELHGLGAQTIGDLRDHNITVVSREQGVGRGRQPLTPLAELTNGAGGSPTSTYTAIPFAMTPRRSFDLTGHAVSVWDVRDGLTITQWQDHLDLQLAAANDPRGLLPAAGGPGTGGVQWNLPGMILGAQGGRSTAEGKLNRLRDAGAEVSALWLQDWPGQRRTGFGERVWWLWQADQERYPDMAGLAAELREQGTQLFLYTNPFLADAGERPDWPGRNLFAEAADQGFLVRRADGSPYLTDHDGFFAGMVDLSNPDAGRWFHTELRAEYDRLGATGGMADFAEGPPFDARLAGGSAAELHNAWPMLWARYQPGGWAFHRSAAGHGPAGADRPVMMWAGDQLPTWDRHDGMASAIAAILSAGVSGQPLMHADVGGYTGLSQPLVGVRRDAELLLRWAEWSVFSPALRTHEGNQPDRFVQVWDEEVVAPFARLARMFTELAEYRGSVIDEALFQGRPAMAPLWLDWPGSRAAASAPRTATYRFGGFVVSPVLRPGGDRVRTVLPPGTWRHLWSERRFGGERLIEVDAPLGRPAVFHRDGDTAAAEVAEKLRTTR